MEIVNHFMKENLGAIQGIINGLPRPFDSHAFIRRFMETFQAEYVVFLCSCLNEHPKDPFTQVHLQIGNFLVKNQKALGITANGKVKSEDIFGNRVFNEQWL
jgi:hypothetical protein